MMGKKKTKRQEGRNTFRGGGKTRGVNPNTQKMKRHDNLWGRGRRTSEKRGHQPSLARSSQGPNGAMALGQKQEACGGESQRRVEKKMYGNAQRNDGELITSNRRFWEKIKEGKMK